MPTFSEQHCAAVRASVDLVAGVTQAHLDLPTPCAEWTLRDLLAHMTAQHHGFAAAARGHGADLTVWRAEPIVAAIDADPHGTYAAAADDVLAAFAEDGVDERPFALPEFGEDVTVPGEMAMGFHFVDYVVHGWDLAATLGTAFTPQPEVLAAVLPLAMSVPDGEVRDAADSPFARGLEQTDNDDFARLLRHLGRTPA